jgi:hypothetical protein
VPTKVLWALIVSFLLMMWMRNKRGWLLPLAAGAVVGGALCIRRRGRFHQHELLRHRQSFVVQHSRRPHLPGAFVLIVGRQGKSRPLSMAPPG